MSSIQTEQEIAGEENKLKDMLISHNVVEQEKLKLQKNILELQLKKKDLEIILDKSWSEINIKKLNIKMLVSKFWHEKNSGL